MDDQNQDVVIICPYDALPSPPNHHQQHDRRVEEQQCPEHAERQLVLDLQRVDAHVLVVFFVRVNVLRVVIILLVEQFPVMDHRVVIFVVNVADDLRIFSEQISNATQNPVTA